MSCFYINWLILSNCKISNEKKNNCPAINWAPFFSCVSRILYFTLTSLLFFISLYMMNAETITMFSKASLTMKKNQYISHSLSFFSSLRLHIVLIYTICRKRPILQTLAIYLHFLCLSLKQKTRRLSLLFKCRKFNIHTHRYPKKIYKINTTKSLPNNWPLCMNEWMRKNVL